MAWEFTPPQATLNYWRSEVGGYAPAPYLSKDSFKVMVSQSPQVNGTLVIHNVNQLPNTAFTGYLLFLVSLSIHSLTPASGYHFPNKQLTSKYLSQILL